MPLMRRLRSFLLLLIALWLPLQAAAAVALPMCRHAHEQRTETVSCHGQLVEVVVQAADAGCDNCEMCHLATAGYLPSVSVTALAPATSERVALLPAESPSFIADPPEQPPRRAA